MRARAKGIGPLGLRRRQESFRKVVESISSELELQPLLTSIIKHVCELLGVPHGSIGLLDPDIKAVRITATYGIPEDRIGFVMGPEAPVAGRVLRTHKQVIQQEYGRVPGSWPEIAGCTVMSVPILRKRRLLGIFGVGAPPPRRFSRGEVALVSLFARHAAIAISNAQDFERELSRTARLSLITRVSRIISAGLELDDLLRRTAKAIHRVLGYPSVALGLVEQGGEEFLIRAIGGRYGAILPGIYRQETARGIAGAAIRERTIQLVADVRLDPRYVPTPGALGTLAELAVPILLGGEALGVINVEGAVPFRPEDADTLQLIAQHLAPAIRNAALFERERLRTRRLSLISRIGRIAATGLNRQDLLQRSADAIHELLGYANVDIPTLDEPDVLVFRARGGGHKRIQRTDRLHLSQGIIGAAAREARTQLVNNVATDPRYVTPPLNVKNSAELAVPIIHGGEVLGVLNVEGPAPFDDDDAASLQVVADHLAVAIHNAELHASAQREAIHGERRRLSRDLHDSVTQLLFSLSLLAQSLAPAWRRSPAEGEQKANRVIDLASAALREMRDLIGALYPASLTIEEIDAGANRPLLARLRDLTRDRPDGGPKVRFRSKGWVSQASGLENVLYRVGQEALTNAFKHARARQVDVLLSANSRHLCLTVADDGVGFRRKAPRARLSRSGHGLGLGIMEARVLEQSGRLMIRSTPNRGTTIHVRLGRR